MKVVWFSATPISLNAGENTGVEGKGWISALLQLALDLEGLELVVAYENYSPEKKAAAQAGRLKIVPINISRYSKRQIIKDMMTKREVDELVIAEGLRIVREEKPDLIHVFGTEWCFGMLTKHVNMLNVPVVIHIQGLWSQIRNCLLLPGQCSLFDRLKPELLTHPLGLFARYHYYNISTERHLREEDILRGNKYFMCRTRWDEGVVRFYNRDAKIFHVDEALRTDFMNCSRRWEVKKSEEVKSEKVIRICTTGACYSIKGPDVVLKTARLLKDNTDYRIEWKWIGGSDEDIREFEKLTKIKAKDVGVRMMGTLSAQQMIDELLTADMYVHASYADNSPNAVCEAQALGLPVIATDAGGVVSLFSEGYDRNMIVPVNDPFYLASRIIALREDRHHAQQLSHENWIIAHKRHDYHRIAKQLQDSYLEICG